MREYIPIPVIIGLIAISLTVIFVVNSLMNGYNYVENIIPNSGCEELLNMIRETHPNYPYDVREWIAKECWK